MIKHTKATSNKYYKLKKNEKSTLKITQKQYSSVNTAEELTSILEKIQKPYFYSKWAMFIICILFFVFNASVLYNTVINSKSTLPIDYIAISITTVTLINGNLIPKLFNYFVNIIKEQYFNSYKSYEETEIIEVKLWNSEIQLFSYLTIFFASFPFLYFVIGSYISQFLSLTMMILAILVLIIYLLYKFKRTACNLLKSIFSFSKSYKN